MDDLRARNLSGFRIGSFPQGLVYKYKIRKERRRRGAREARRIKGADAVVFSPGNSGRTWLRSMLSSVLGLHYGIDPAPRIDFDNLYKIDSRLPIVFFTHNRWLKYYRKVRPGFECDAYYDSNLVVLVRNPIDTCVSQYYQWLHRSKDLNVMLKGWPARSSNLSLGEFLDHPETGVGRLCDELNIWLRESSKCRNAMFIRYEDLIADTVGGLERIADFLRVNVSPDTISEAVRINSFDNMQEREVADGSIATEALKTRRGEIGGYMREICAERCQFYQDLVSSKLSADLGYQALPLIMPMNISHNLV